MRWSVCAALIAVAVLVLIPSRAIAAGQTFSSAPPYECPSIKLTAACGFPDGDTHLYVLEGTCAYQDGEIKKAVSVKVSGAYAVTFKTASEQLEVEGAGGTHATFLCDDDPWVTSSHCSMQLFYPVAEGVLKDFAAQYYSGAGPLTRSYVNASVAALFAPTCAKGPSPPPKVKSGATALRSPIRPPSPKIKPHEVPSTPLPGTRIDQSKVQLRPKGTGKGDEDGGQGDTPATTPGIPQIAKPFSQFASCGSIPVEVHASGPTIAIDVGFEYHTPNCGDAPSCWNAKSVSGVITPIAGIDWTMQIVRAAFPKKGEWRVHARGLGTQQQHSAWSNWRGFRVKRASECP